MNQELQDYTIGDLLLRAEASLVEVCNRLGDCDTSADLAEVINVKLAPFYDRIRAEGECGICYGKGHWISKEGAEIPCDICATKF